MNALSQMQTLLKKSDRNNSITFFMIKMNFNIDKVLLNYSQVDSKPVDSSSQ